MNHKLGLILIFLSLYSCTVYKDYPLDVYRPGVISIPPETDRVALVYRNFKYQNDTLLHYYKNDYKLSKAKNDPSDLDSILAFTCLNSFASQLKSNTDVAEVGKLPYHIFKRHRGEKLPKLDMEVVQKLATIAGTDILISLETFSSFYSSYSTEFESLPAKEVITVAVWGVYDSEGKKLLDHKAMIDTIIWQPYDEQGNYLPDYKAPPRLEALRMAAEMAGEEYAKRFYPSWQTVIRQYSIPPVTDFSLAGNYFEERKYEDAIDLWKRYADKRNGKMAIHARYNLALAYEILDNPDLALKWLAAARDLAISYRSQKDLVKIDRYHKLLLKRKRELEILRQQ